MTKASKEGPAPALPVNAVFHATGLGTISLGFSGSLSVWFKLPCHRYLLFCCFTRSLCYRSPEVQYRSASTHAELSPDRYLASAACSWLPNPLRQRLKPSPPAAVAHDRGPWYPPAPIPFPFLFPPLLAMPSSLARKLQEVTVKS